jgi:hypothetical protein
MFIYYLFAISKTCSTAKVYFHMLRNINRFSSCITVSLQTQNTVDTQRQADEELKT